MKINEVTEAGPDYETNPQHKKLATIGRALMAHSETASMKGKNDDQIRMFNQMSSLGNALTKFGTTFGPKNIQDIVDETDLNPAMIKTLLGFGEKLAKQGVKAKIADPGAEPDDADDDFAQPDNDDDAMAARADRMARAR